MIPRVGVVAIGRNEGERLRVCLESARRDVHALVYVDSGSTDGSVEICPRDICRSMRGLISMDDVSPMRISQIVNGKRAVTADTAMRLAQYFGTSPDVWIRLQARYDLEVAELANGDRIRREVKVLDRSKLSALPQAS